MSSVLISGMHKNTLTHSLTPLKFPEPTWELAVSYFVDTDEELKLLQVSESDPDPSHLSSANVNSEHTLKSHTHVFKLPA